MSTFIPFIMQIVEQYYQNTPNAENGKKSLSLADGLARLALEESKSAPIAEDR